MKVTRAFDTIAQELDELLTKSAPYALSTPQLGNPTIHDFVKGLILSTNIIELIDKHIPNGYRADWGQVIDVKDGNALSKECDIIVYEGKPFKLIKNRSMNFVLVDKNRTKIVIQVRSSIQSVTADDLKYCKELNKFVPEVWYIAECCWATSKSRAENIKRELKRAGYKQFFHFIIKNDNNETIAIGYDPFFNFINLIKNL